MSSENEYREIFDILCIRIHKSVTIVHYAKNIIHLESISYVSQRNLIGWHEEHRYYQYAIQYMYNRIYRCKTFENYYFFFCSFSLFMCSIINEQTLKLFASIEPYIWFLKQAKDAFTLIHFHFPNKNSVRNALWFCLLWYLCLRNGNVLAECGVFCEVDWGMTFGQCTKMIERDILFLFLIFLIKKELFLVYVTSPLF